MTRIQTLLAAVAVASAAVTGTVLAQRGFIETDQVRVEERQTPEANIVTITDIERSAGGAVIEGRTRSYTEAR